MASFKCIKESGIYIARYMNWNALVENDLQNQANSNLHIDHYSLLELEF